MKVTYGQIYGGLTGGILHEIINWGSAIIKQVEK
jgi:hypothetical protein